MCTLQTAIAKPPPAPWASHAAKKCNTGFQCRCLNIKMLQTIVVFLARHRFIAQGASPASAKKHAVPLWRTVEQKNWHFRSLLYSLPATFSADLSHVTRFGCMFTRCFLLSGRA